ncbi:CidA/LrgA family protein [Cohnella massiliensis]|uniref:CidA/LrgA family protein n=1 Tax=Cohnella massiliensis TaxID=1816691 RepID=UPI0009BB8C8C|nr:CidA/LrgA family protein [Cohnella massiliensis]
MLGFGILLLFNLIGLGLKEGLDIPMPANLIGLILFTLALYAKLVKLEWVEAAAEFLTKHMMLFFIPFIVSAMALLPLLGKELLPIAASVLLGPAVVIAVAGFATARLRKKADREEAAS